MEVCYRYIDVTELADAERFAEGMARLPWEERREKIRRLRPEGGKRLSLGAGLLLLSMLQDAGVTDFTLSENEHGKPYLLQYPNIHFNLSHSGTLAVCAVADAPVGIDTEEKRPKSDGVARRFFTAEEYQYLEAAKDKDRAFLSIWTRKESYLKLLGCGFAKSPETFSVLSEDALGVHFTEHEVAGQPVCICTHEKPIDKSSR